MDDNNVVPTAVFSGHYGLSQAIQASHYKDLYVRDCYVTKGQ